MRNNVFNCFWDSQQRTFFNYLNISYINKLKKRNKNDSTIQSEMN